MCVVELLAAFVRMAAVQQTRTGVETVAAVKCRRAGCDSSSTRSRSPARSAAN